MASRLAGLIDERPSHRPGLQWPEFAFILDMFPLAEPAMIKGYAPLI